MQYDFDEFVSRAGTHATKWEARPDLLPLWTADMDLPCAEPIIQALHRRVDRRIFGYTDTMSQAYTDAVLGWFARRHGWQAQKEWIRYSAGVVQALSALIHILSKPGDGILIQPPVYGPFSSCIRARERVLYNNPLRCTRDESGIRYAMDYDDLEVKLADPAIVGIIICNPHNPVGRVWTPQELQRLVDIARKNNKWIICDEIHCDLVRKGVKHTPMLTVAGDWADHVFVCTSPSKTFNLAGMQLSNTFIPSAEVRKAWDAYMGGVLHIGMANPLSIEATIAAYNEGDEWLDQLSDYLDDNLAFVRTYLAKHLPKAVMAPCEGTYLAWVDLSAYEPDPAVLTRRLLEEARVFLSSGDFFGEPAAFQRINTACPRSILQEALDRITATLLAAPAATL